MGSIFWAEAMSADEKSAYSKCPRCGGQIVTDRRTSENGCLQCGYEWLASVPTGQNRSQWAKREVKLPVYGTREEVYSSSKEKARANKH